MSFSSDAIYKDEPFSESDLFFYMTMDKDDMLTLWDGYNNGLNGRKTAGVRHRQMGKVLLERGLVTEAELALVAMGVEP